MRSCLFCEGEEGQRRIESGKENGNGEGKEEGRRRKSRNEERTRRVDSSSSI
jgi:hypothetical protein